MTVWLVTRDVNFFKRVPTAKQAWHRLSLEDNPSPTVTTAGLRMATGERYWLEDDGMTTSVPKESRPKRGRQLFDATAAKPPYRVPLVAEIAKTKQTGLTVVTTFAGCGGSSLGYRMAGYRVVWANEFVPVAQESYRANMAKGTILDGRDIKAVTAEEIMKAAGLKKGELDLLDGSPPCQAFSTAGKREKGWGTDRKYEHGASQRNEDLFDEYVRLLAGLRPRAFVAENVSGLVKGVAKGYFLKILAALKEPAPGLRYRVVARLLDAQWLGVPQQRQRIIFVGVREDLGLDPAFPTPLPYRYSVRDALPWLGGGTMGSGHAFSAQPLDPDAPAHTVLTNEWGGAYRDHEVEIVGNSNAAHTRKGERRGTDQPSRTVMSRRVNLEVEIKTGHGGSRRHREEGRSADLDAPLPAVLAGGAKDKRSPQFFVETKPDASIEYRGQPGGKKWSTRRRSIDEPSAAVSAEGYGGAARHQAHVVEERLVQGPQVDQRNEGRAIDLDGPAAAVAAKQSASLSVSRVIHDDGRKPPRDITDGPAPTITAGPNDAAEGGGPRNHFKVVHDAGRPGVEPKDITDRPSPTVTVRHANYTHFAVEPETDISGQAIGREYDRLNEGQQSDKYFSLVRTDAAKPAPTMTAAGGQNSGIACAVHPTEKRKFSIGELRRICAFPDDFVLIGSYAQQWERLGNSVPPVMMFHIAAAVRDRVLIPARAAARSTAPPARSRARSTSDSRPKGAGKKRSRAGSPRKAKTSAAGNAPA